MLAQVVHLPPGSAPPNPNTTSPKMLNLPRIQAIHLLPALALTFALPAMPQETGPPGMVFVKGGRYKIGADKDDVAEALENKQPAALVTETPQYEARLDDFFIMPTEVTNEQFARYIQATNARPPQSWGQKALDDATFAYTTEMGKLREEAKKNGEEPPKIEPFNRSEWWKENWMEAEWAIPKGQENKPVVYIDYEQAEGYARWAGLRLMSEEEFQAVGRGDSERYYPWGDAFENKSLNSLDAKRGGPMPVGSYVAGTAWVDGRGKIVDERNERNESEVVGIYDLCGNVWEWTRTPFNAYPKYKPISIKDPKTRKKESIDYLNFDPNNRSSVGGGFNSAAIASRLTTRRNTARFQSTAGLGMRCTASAVPGLDIADSILRTDLPPSRRPDGAFYTPEAITAIDRWTSTAGNADVPGYRVIESYDYLAFIPNEKLEVSSVMLLKDRSHEAPHELGAFSTTLPLLEPELPPGTYTLSWRAMGEFNEVVPEDVEGEAQMRQDDGGEGELMAPPEFPFSPEEDTLIFRNLDGEIVGWTQVAPPKEERLAPGRVTTREVAPEAAAKAGRKAGTELQFEVYVPYTKSNKGFLFEIPVLVKGGSISGDWRK